MTQPLPRRRRRGSFAVITLAMILAIYATVSLGRWQLSRAAQKEALQAGIDAQKLLPPIDQDAFLALGDVKRAPPDGPGLNDLMYRPVKLRGLWLAPQTVYLDNRQMNGLQGFYVLTPFAIEGSEQTVMVQRGWVQRNFSDRTQLAPIDTPAGLVEVTGLIAPPPAHLLELGKAESASGAASAAASAGPAGAAVPASEITASAPTSTVSTSAAAASSPDTVPAVPVGSYPIRQNLSLQAFRTETRLPLRTDLSLQQTGGASEGLQRNWPAPALGVEKHYGYAFQWFGLSALLAVLYVWFQLISPWLRRRRERATVYFTQPNDPR
ncbi:SURF1 family protein [Variovorax sp. RHLX14]|uniref:SURF1 family protein n=1 Tax=Variovorax sp. RHLX14 TaxID=1259731 RepID=UPI003F47220A